jgi:uncharacterized protein YbjT (DUF2867 family)
MSAIKKVVVTGAGGRTGKLVAKKLHERNTTFTDIRAVIRSGGAKDELEKMSVSCFPVDVAAGKKEDYAEAFREADALIIATSAVPKLNVWSLPKVFWARLTGGPSVMPDFDWRAGQTPEKVDWEGQKAQIDAAVSASVKHVVLLSSMGGTQDGKEGRTMNMLNKLGNGDILLWKRKAEQYLIASGISYTSQPTPLTPLDALTAWGLVSMTLSAGGRVWSFPYSMEPPWSRGDYSGLCSPPTAL